MSVHLRRLRETDGARVLAWRNAPEVAAYMYSDHPITPEEHAAWLRSALTRADRRYWIVELEGRPVGLANLAAINEDARRCDWAFYLADPAVRGRGVGAAVEWLVIGHVFGALRLNKLCCEVLVENTAVIRLHERFGFTREALYREHVFKGGEPRDVVGLALLTRDWAAVRVRARERLAIRFDPERLTLEA